MPVPSNFYSLSDLPAFLHSPEPPGSWFCILPRVEPLARENAQSVASLHGHAGDAARLTHPGGIQADTFFSVPNSQGTQQQR